MKVRFIKDTVQNSELYEVTREEMTDFFRGFVKARADGKVGWFKLVVRYMRKDHNHTLFDGLLEKMKACKVERIETDRGVPWVYVRRINVGRPRLETR